MPKDYNIKDCLAFEIYSHEGVLLSRIPFPQEVGKFDNMTMRGDHIFFVDPFDGGRGGGRGPRLCLGIRFRRTRPWLKATGEWRAEGSSLDQADAGTGEEFISRFPFESENRTGRRPARKMGIFAPSRRLS
ncbi:MAG: hypothetical protein Q8O57_11255, partial [Kiritimatiellota bacterium]|nr:hypothetical protein [Kiritimatiellota bacterium]